LVKAFVASAYTYEAETAFGHGHRSMEVRKKYPLGGGRELSGSDFLTRIVGDGLKVSQ
jgi:hypothetical protein